MAPHFTTARRTAAADRRGGFSLVELLVVIGIIVLLAGILLPTVVRSVGAGERGRIRADLASIEMALEAYHTDFGDYPRPARNEPNTGFAALTKALIGPGPEVDTTADAPPPYDSSRIYEAGEYAAAGSGPGLWYVKLRRSGDAPSATSADWANFNWDDGHDGLGFKSTLVAAGDAGETRSTGNVSGPYLDPGRFDLRGMAILDVVGNPILYFTGNPKPGPTNRPEYFADANDFARFDLRQGLGLALRDGETTPADARLRMLPVLGDFSTDGGLDTTAAVAEPQAPAAEYLLWSAGSDGQFGVKTAVDGSADNDAANTNRVQVQGGEVGGETYTAVDDVTNLQ